MVLNNLCVWAIIIIILEATTILGSGFFIVSKERVYNLRYQGICY